ncbi:MAG: lipoyl synthase [Candidatus Omnitrophota bacterium]|nr:lipoyl synthase [Candidatus Omnitrophota bacterium]
MLSLNIMLPSWFRQAIPGRRALDVSRMLLESGAHTVCKEASCPNSGRCLGEGIVTFMILGNTCTRNCSFCNISSVGTGFKPVPTAIDGTEPLRIARLVNKLVLDYAVVTSVSRDDLGDCGAGIFSRTTGEIRKINSRIKIELLIPDFKGRVSLLEQALSPIPDVAAHNIETVRRLYHVLRPQAQYRRSLGVLKTIKKIRPQVITKSALMLGLGEEKFEVLEAMQDLRAQDCNCLVLGQYLSPSPAHYPVKEYIEPRQFEDYRGVALGLGFKSVLSLPLARASFRAKEMYEQAAGRNSCMN